MFGQSDVSGTLAGHDKVVTSFRCPHKIASQLSHSYHNPIILTSAPFARLSSSPSIQADTMSSSKHVIVTGAARGIGRCIARSALEKGWKVFMLDIQEVGHLHVLRF
jgi:hypothetical protein